MIIIDDGFAAAIDWPLRQKTALSLIAEANRNNRTLYVASTAKRALADTGMLSPLAYDNARALIQELVPKAWNTDRAVLTARLNALQPLKHADIFWLADGLVAKNEQAGLKAFVTALHRHGAVRIFMQDAQKLPVLIQTPQLQGQTLRVPLKRFSAKSRANYRLVAKENSGKINANVNIAFAPGKTTATAAIELPSAIRNRLEQLTLSDPPPCGGHLPDGSALAAPAGRFARYRGT